MMMEKTSQEQLQQQQQQQQQRLKCPRCASWNTKFCYYNNYSLSQPRHFCKGCKRYWTSGGTLRNVPVGGSCRKINKRIKKPSATSSISTTQHTNTLTPSISTTNTNPSHHIHQAQIDTNSSLLYGLLPTNPSNLKLPSPRLFNFEVSNIATNSGLGYFQDFGTKNSSSLISSNPICGSSTVASLIASSLQQHNFQGLSTYEDQEIPGKYVQKENGMSMKMEGDGQNRLVWNLPNHQKNQTEKLNSSDPSLSWTGANWFDSSNVGSSVPSLI